MGIRNKRYLIFDEDGSCAAMSRTVSTGVFELSKSDDVGILIHPYGNKEFQHFETDDGRTMIQIDGETYEEVPLKERRCDPVVWIRKLIARHYKLRLKDQRQYIARCVGQIIGFLLVDGNVHAIPDTINDFAVLLPVAIRKYRDSGEELNLAQQKCRQQIILIIKKLVEVKHSGSSQKDILLDACNTFTHKSGTDAFHMDHTVVPEEIMEAVTLLRRLNEAQLHDFLTKVLEIIQRAEDKLQSDNGAAESQPTWSFRVGLYGKQHEPMGDVSGDHLDLM